MNQVRTLKAKVTSFDAESFFKEQFSKLTKEQQQETLADFKERDFRGFDKRLQIKVLNELLGIKEDRLFT